MYRYQLHNTAFGTRVLETEPEGWDSLEYELERHPRYHGFSTEFSLELTFYKDGYDFLHAVYESYGIEGECKIVIWESEALNFGWRRVYEGTIALDTVQFGEELWAKTNIEQHSFVTAFLNNDEVKVNLQGNESVSGSQLEPLLTGFPTVATHSRVVVQRYEAYNTNTTRNSSTPIELAGQRKQRIMYGFDNVKLNEVGALQYTTGFAPQDIDMELFTATTSAEWALDAYINSRLEVEIMNGDFNHADLKIYLRKNNDAPLVLFSKVLEHVTGAMREVMSARVNTTISMVPGDKLYLYGEFHLTDITGNYRFMPFIQLGADSYLKITGGTTTGSTGVKAVLLHEAFARICSAVTNERDIFYSPLLGRVDSSPRQYLQDGEYSGIAITNGFMLRNFPIDGVDTRNIYSTFSGLFDEVNALACVGVGIEVIEGKQMFILEKREHFYSNEVVLKLGKVSSLTKTPTSEHYYNEAEVGYSDWSSETTNGLDEFNAKLEYTLPVTKVKNKYSAICKYIAGGYKIEETRRQQYEQNVSKDSKDDEKNFLLAVARAEGGWETERMHKFAEVTGVSEPASAYNLRLCPARMLQRHLAFLHPSFYKQEHGFLRFNKGEGKYAMGTRMDNETMLLESAVNVQATAMPQPQYVPEHYEFTCKLTPTQVFVLQQRPYGLVEFETATGVMKRGHIVKVVGKTHDKEAKFKVLRKYEDE